MDIDSDDTVIGQLKTTLLFLEKTIWSKKSHTKFEKDCTILSEYETNFLHNCLRCRLVLPWTSYYHFLSTTQNQRLSQRLIGEKSTVQRFNPRLFGDTDTEKTIFDIKTSNFIPKVPREFKAYACKNKPGMTHVGTIFKAQQII